MRDRAEEDRRQRCAIQLEQVAERGEVVGDGNRTERDGDVDDHVRSAGGGELCIGQRHVGGREIGRGVEEMGDAGPGADRLVVNADIGVLLAVGGKGGLEGGRVEG